MGRTYASVIQAWQPRAQWSAEVEWVGAMIQEDAQRVLDLDAKITALETTMHHVAQESTLATMLASIPGFGPVGTAELAGEIGTVERFSQEGSLALYLGMATLDNSSGTRHGAKPPKQVNARAKAAMMTAVDRHASPCRSPNNTTRRNARRGNPIPRRFGHWAVTCAGSSTRC